MRVNPQQGTPDSTGFPDRFLTEEKTNAQTPRV